MRFASCLYALMVMAESLGYYYPPIYWHKDNCVFRLLRESYDPNEPKEYFMKVLPYQKVYVVCPNQLFVNDWSRNPYPSGLYQNMWMVDKTGYDNCSVNEQGDPNINKRILTCDDPQKVKFKKFTFHHTRNTDEPKFAPGHHYYFIATGNGWKATINQKYGGNCKKYHVKLHIYVCNQDKEDCVWERPDCAPPYEFKIQMMKYSRSLPPRTRRPTLRQNPAPQTTTTNATTQASVPPNRFQSQHECKDESQDGDTVHLILNFVLGGVILFMAVVIIILSCGLAKRSGKGRPTSVAFSAISGQELNGNIYQDGARFIPPTYASVPRSLPQTPIRSEPPFFLAPMTEIRPRSSSNKNGFNNTIYTRRLDSCDASTIPNETTAMLPHNDENDPQPV